MGKVIYSHNVSLDGYIEGPNGELDWAIVDESLYRRFNELENAIGAHLYGRRTYQSMAKAMLWASQDNAAPDYVAESARIWLDKPKFVFSKTLERVEWNSTLVKDNVGEEIAKLKRQIDKDMYLAGANLASSVIPLGLIDEYRLYVNSVVLGAGKAMFPRDGGTMPLRLEEVSRLGSGVVLLRYCQLGERHNDLPAS